MVHKEIVTDIVTAALACPRPKTRVGADFVPPAVELVLVPESAVTASTCVVGNLIVII